MMATRKTSTPAAINRQIDAINRGRGTNPTASKSAKIKADVRRFAKEHGIAISPNAGESPLMGKGDWFKVFDSWLQAHDYFTGWKWKHVDHGLPFPWDDRKSNPTKKNPMLPEAKSRKPANFPYGVETRATENWSLQAAFKEKAKAVEYAHALAAQYPRLPVRVIHYTGGPIK